MKDSNENLTRLKEEFALDLIKNALKKQKIVKIRFIGDSMTPSIRNGEMIILKDESPDYIQIGNVVIFNRGKDLICHRVMWKVCLDKLYFLTRGDNTTSYDLPVPAEAVYGKAILSKAKTNVVPKISLKTKLFFLISIILLKLESKISTQKPYYINLAKKFAVEFSKLQRVKSSV